MPERREIEELFHSFHSEFESIVMELVEGKIDKCILDAMFEDFDTLQEFLSGKSEKKRSHDLQTIAGKVYFQT